MKLFLQYKSDPAFKEFMSLHAPKQVDSLLEDENEEEQNSEDGAVKDEEEKPTDKLANLKISDTEVCILDFCCYLYFEKYKQIIDSRL